MNTQAVLFRTFNPGDINSTEYLTPSYLSRGKPRPESEGSEMVSALMVTRGCIDKVQGAVRSFARQTWRNKELVIVSDDVGDSFVRAVDESRQGSCVRIYKAFSSGSLGDLRNYSVARAHGEFVCQWDDVDLYHPDRIRASMQVLKEADVDAVF